MDLSVSLLGTFSVTLNNQEVTGFSYDKVRALLAYLIMESSYTHRRESLVGLLWPDYPESQARQSLSQALSTLRGVIGDRSIRHSGTNAYIEATRQTVTFNKDSHYWLDVDDYSSHLHAAQKHPHKTLSSCEQCITYLEQAVALYRGDFLENLTIDDSAAFEEWALLHRENLKRQMMDALHQLTQVYLEQKKYKLALEQTRHQLKLDPWHEPAHRQVMQALVLDGQRAAALKHYEMCSETLATELQVAPEDATVALYESIRDGSFQTFHAPLPPGVMPPAPGMPPFKGLHFFDVADAHLFFGREVLTSRIIEHLNDGDRFLAIVGASGSGKSSLVRAGVVATLLPETGWDIHIMTPTADPVTALCRSISSDSGVTTDIAILRDAMYEDDHALFRFVEHSTSECDQLLFVVDQFEELFTLCRDAREQRVFLDNLLNAVTAPSPVAVVIALRADFYHHCAEHELLRKAIESHQMYIGAMTYEELCYAIVRPAQSNNWSFEPGLVDLMLEDIGAVPHRPPEPGALPLLSHALLETWKRRQGRTLTLRGYAEAGGVRGAIAQSAEAVYRALSPDRQAIARNIFLRLTEFGDVLMNTDSALYTRRRVPLEEMHPTPTAESEIQMVLDTLVQARLVTVERDAIEVAHEALIREWPTLRTWLEADLEGLRIHRHLTEAAQVWVDGGRLTGDLYRGTRLAQVEEWAQAENRELNTLEDEFLKASKHEMERIEAERDAQRQRELDVIRNLAEVQQRRAEERGRLLHWIGVAAGLLLLIAIAAVFLGHGYRVASLESASLARVNATTAAQNAFVAATAQAAEVQALEARERESEQRTLAEAMKLEALTQRDIAQQQARLNLVMSLVGQANIHQEKNSELALLLASEANTMLDSALTRGGLVSTLEHSPGRVHFLTGSAGSVETLAVSPDGSMLVSAGAGEIRFWDASTGEPIPNPLTGLGDVVRDLSFMGDRQVLAALVNNQDKPPFVLFWNIGQDARQNVPLGVLNSAHFSGGIESYLTISPDGRYLALAGCGKPMSIPSGLAFCESGSGVTLWDISSILEGTGEIREVGFLDIPGEVYNVAFDPGGENVALVGCANYDANNCAQGFASLWQSDTGDVIELIQDAFKGHSVALLNSIAFTPDGMHLAMGGCSYYDASGVCMEGSVDLWDLVTFTSVAQLTTEGENGIQSLAISPDGQLIAIGSSDTIRLWEPATQALKGMPMIGHTGHVLALAFTPDGQTLFSAGQDLKIGMWDLALRGGIGNRLALNPMPSFHIDFAPDGYTIAESTVGGIQLWDAATGELLNVLQLNNAEGIVWDVDFSPDGEMLASAGLSDGAITLWDIASMAPVGNPFVPEPGESAYSVAFSPDGLLLATSGDGAGIWLWDVESLITGTPVSRTLTGHGYGGNPQIVFSPDGTLLASAGHDDTARLWDVAAGVQVGKTLSGHDDNVLTVAFSPDGRVLASAGQDTSIRLWDVATQDLIKELAGHNQFVWRLAFTPDGNTLVSLDAWGVLRLWDMRDPENPGQPAGATLPGHQAWAWGLALSPDGTTAVTSARSGEIMRWHISLDWWRKRACDIAGRNLMLGEWALYLPGEPYRETCAIGDND